MGLPNWLGFSGAAVSNELREMFPMTLAESSFVLTDVKNIYSQILTDTLERTDGIDSTVQSLLWDNCSGGNSQDGLVSMLAEAMTNKSDLFLIYEAEVKVVRKATMTEQEAIKKDYALSGESKIGAYVTFKKYNRTDLVKFYSSLEYCVISSLWKSMNLSKAIQIKINEMRSSTGLSDSTELINQAKSIAEGLSKGKDVALDAKDLIENAKPDMTATQTAMQFVNERKSFYLSMPSSYLGTEANQSLGDSGKKDSKQVERGLKGYFFSIIKPVMESVFGKEVTFKSEDFDEITSSLEVLKTFDITSDEYLSKEKKQLIVNKKFGLPEDSKGDEPEPIPPPVNTIPVQ